MKILVTVKQGGKRKAFLTKQPFDLQSNPTNLRELLTEIITINVNEYNGKPLEDSIMEFLSKEEMEDQAQTGKVGFNRRYSDRQGDQTEAIETALLAYKDGIFRVFHGDMELTSLDEPLELNEGDVFTFIKFTMLAGRLW